MLAQLVSMMGYSTDFDTVLCMAIQELSLDSSIFISPHFEKFAKFVITKSLKIKSLQIDPPFRDVALLNNPDTIRLLKSHCQTVVSISDMGVSPFSSAELLEHSYYVKFIHYLNWTHEMFSILLNSGLLSQLHRLRKLVIRLKGQDDIAWLNEVISAPWFKASTKLVLQFDPEQTSDAVDCLPILNDILKKK
ncbi:unnamed protein product [Ambrosiozyma monospora]|uniref:Unnamed protein product n=1 Tax=Ambrosiozyma monospora TaxID=43982 RepID=A0ACB5SWG7_AMBMO|nr:unnamed protein product [Ambrosiozyma monospora]